MDGIGLDKLALVFFSGAAGLTALEQGHKSMAVFMFVVAAINLVAFIYLTANGKFI